MPCGEGEEGSSLALSVWRTVLVLSWGEGLSTGGQGAVVPLFVVDYVVAAQGAQLL